jgi:hypothetical protein
VVVVTWQAATSVVVMVRWKVAATVMVVVTWQAAAGDGGGDVAGGSG